MPTSVFLNLSQGGEQFTGQLIGPAADNTATPPFTFSGDLDTGLASAAAGTVDLMADGTAALALTTTTATFAPNVVPSMSRTGIATTSSDGYVAANGTAATASVPVQYSPRVRLVGSGWNSSGGGTAETDTWIIENRPATVAGTTTQQLYLSSSIAGGAYSDKFSFGSDGVLSATSATVTSVLASSQLNVGSGGAFRSNSNGTNITMPANGQLNFNNNGASAGAGFDVTTDALIQVRTRAQTGFASVAALNFQNTNSTNGQTITALQTLTELTTIAAAASTDTTIQMPAGAVVLAVTVRVTTVIPTAATFTVGDSGSAARFSTTTVSTAAGSTDAGTKAGAYYNASALAIRITPNAQPADNTGRVRVAIFYYTVTPPTS